MRYVKEMAPGKEWESYYAGYQPENKPPIVALDYSWLANK